MVRWELDAWVATRGWSSGEREKSGVRQVKVCYFNRLIEIRCVGWLKH